MIKPAPLEKLLLQITVFLIPTNLAYHWITDQAYVAGKLVDYLIPKLYLSDVPLLIMLFIWLLKSEKKIDIKKLSKYLPLVVCFAFFFVRSLLTPYPLAAIWFLLKLAELAIWLLYLKSRFPISTLLSTIKLPLLLTIWFQSLVGIFQFINQKSLFGYYFLGESALSATANIAKASLSGALKILPYGTTPHPNVLAGFLATSTLLLLLCMQKKSRSQASRTLTIITIGLSLICLMLTSSLTAFTAISIVFVLFFLQKNASRVIYKVIISLLLISSLLTLLITPVSTSRYIRETDNPSLYRRFELIDIAKKLILSSKILIGTGLNQFTAAMTPYPPITAETAFLQPVHNVYLLWITETGLLGLALLILSIRYIFTHTAPPFTPAYSLPLLILLIIGFFDHYPLTLQTGQLLTVLTLSTAFAKK